MTYISIPLAIPVIAGGYFLNFLKIVQGEFFAIIATDFHDKDFPILWTMSSPVGLELIFASKVKVLTFGSDKGLSNGLDFPIHRDPTAEFTRQDCSSTLQIPLHRPFTRSQCRGDLSNRQSLLMKLLCPLWLRLGRAAFPATVDALLPGNVDPSHLPFLTEFQFNLSQS